VVVTTVQRDCVPNVRSPQPRPLTAEQLLTRWRRLPAVDAEALRADRAQRPYRDVVNRSAALLADIEADGVLAAISDPSAFSTSRRRWLSP
jgi:hypothetical protein